MPQSSTSAETNLGSANASWQPRKERTCTVYNLARNRSTTLVLTSSKLQSVSDSEKRRSLSLKPNSNVSVRGKLNKLVKDFPCTLLVKTQPEEIRKSEWNEVLWWKRTRIIAPGVSMVPDLLQPIFFPNGLFFSSVPCYPVSSSLVPFLDSISLYRISIFIT